MKIDNIEFDAFSNGQIQSKLWLCRELEKQMADRKDLVIWTLGGWYGHLAFLLLTRERLSIKKIVSFDLDPTSGGVAEKLNDNFVNFNGLRFRAITADVNDLDVGREIFNQAPRPDIIINTSAEHMQNHKWFQTVQPDQLVVVQATDMEHEEHTAKIHSTAELNERFPLSKLTFSDSLEFKYANSWGFQRFMQMGYR